MEAIHCVIVWHFRLQQVKNNEILEKLAKTAKNRVFDEKVGNFGHNANVSGGIYVVAPMFRGRLHYLD